MTLRPSIDHDEFMSVAVLVYTYSNASIVFQCCTVCNASWPKLGLESISKLAMYTKAVTISSNSTMKQQA